MDHKKLLQVLGFTPKENTSGVFAKKYNDGYNIEIDFEKEIFHFGGKIKIQGKEIQNICKPEDWVVLECVDRLLEKGYKPENISLEKVYPAGHGFSGRLDICVTREDGSEYLLIECKTAGAEFNKALARLNKDGGQLFTYFKFSNKADIIMLYASDLKENNVLYHNEIIKIEDDYRTGDVKDFYDKWNKLTKDNGVFNEWVNPYRFVSKALTPKLLQPIKQEDSNFIFIRFLEILRNNVVSDEGNAFNKIFTLFLCKVYDEKSTKENEELKFQWFEGIDDDVTFQLRLTDLYKNGMLEFLEKEVSDFSETSFEDKFKHLKPEDKKDLLTEIHKLRLEKNNEFAIKEVFDHQSFKENGKVVKQVVELLQGYRIRYNKRQQYLSDFFELLLTTGLKQKVGQYFTPVPIAQFIIKSLPIDKIVNEKLEKGERNNLLPFIIDYAAGSGHFLTESMHEIQRHLDSKISSDYISDTAKKIKTWQDDHFDWATRYVYGIEKDYRLVKVGKVGCYLHGDGLANVILSDGLANFSKTKEYKGLLKKTDLDFPKENKQFDIVLSNPPYSVPAFKLNSREYYTENDFELYNSLSDQSPQIEVLFIERTKQLLKNGGLAGIILPSSILSGEGNYTKAREIILQYFDIIAIAELGSNTFMATGTNTVTLFLRRRNNYDCLGWKSSVNIFFENLKDVIINGIEKPVAKFINHVWENISMLDYHTLLQKSPNTAITENEIYREYRKKIKAKNEKDFWDIVLEKEKEKIYYFIITYSQKVVLVKSGVKEAEKRFLGYDFSEARGRQGIRAIQKGMNIEDCTQLFNPERFDDETKASTYIYKAFNGNFEFPVDESLKNNVTRHKLIDMIGFERVSFEKNISLSVKKKIKIESKYDILELNDILNFAGKGKRPASFSSENGRYTFVASSPLLKRCDTADHNSEAILIGDGGLANIHYLNEEFSASDHMYFLTAKDVSLRYIYYYLSINIHILEDGFKGQTLKNISKSYLQSIKIPVPPPEIQGKVVSELQLLELKEQEARKQIEDYKVLISNEFINLDFNNNNLGNISSFKNGLNYSRESNGETIDIVGVKDFQNNFSPDLNLLEKIQIDGDLSEDYHLQKGDLLVVRSNGSANLVGRFLMIDKLNAKTSYSGFTIRIRPDFEKANPKYLCYYLKSDLVRSDLSENSVGSNIKSLNQTMLSSLKIPLPTIPEQEKVVEKIEKIEKKIIFLEGELLKIPMLKKQVLNEHL